MKDTQRTLLLFGLITMAIATVCAEDDRAMKKDMAQLQGQWSMVSGSADGYVMPDGMRGNSKLYAREMKPP